MQCLTGIEYTVAMSSDHQKRETDEEKASREDVSEDRMVGLFCIDTKAESRYAALSARPYVFPHGL